MRALLNVIWLLLSGLWIALGYALIGALLCITVLLAPFGLQLFKLAGFALWPFGRMTVRSPNHNGGSTVGNVLWLIPGLCIAFGHLVAALACAITIIGIPLAVANIKLIPLSLAPFGREVVDSGSV